MSWYKNKWLILATLSITWGSSFILIKKSLFYGFSPFQIGSIRVLIAGLGFLFIGIPVLKKLNKSTILWMTAIGFLGNFFPMYLFPLAQKNMSSSIASILDALVPTFVLILGVWFFKDKIKLTQTIGIIIGFLGTFVLTYFTQSFIGVPDLAPTLMVILATISYAGSAILINKKMSNIPSFQLTAGIFTIMILPSSIVLLSSGFIEQIRTSEVQWAGFGYLSILSIFGTALAAFPYYYLIQKTSAVFASTVTYTIPLVAVIWGALDGEIINIWYGFGGLLILLGVYLSGEKKDKTPEKTLPISEEISSQQPLASVLEN